jgi:outer membrane protein assembly factor BamB
MRKLWNYRKWLLALALISILLVPAACSSTTTPTSTQATTVAPTVTTTTTVPPPTTTTTKPPATPTPTTTTTPSVSAIPPEVTQYAKDWPLPNKDYANTRATSDSNINSGNIKNLGVAWAVPLPGQGIFGSASTTPIIMGNTAYFQDLGNNVFAADLATGAIKWKKLFNETNIGPNGIAVGWGKVFGSADPYNTAALDMNTGNQVWTSTISTQPTTGTDLQPGVYGGYVLTSTVPGSSAGDFYSGGASGIIYALDQATGKIAWSFNTVDSADIWGNKGVNSGGGCWYPPAVDVNTGTVYWGIGNPAPWPGTAQYPNGSSRPGPNLYTDSMVAVNSKTGQLQWYTQVNPHDNFDLDFESSPILANANINGKQQDIVIGAGKLGRVVAFNRQTGAILWETPVGIHQNDLLANVPSGNVTRVYPGSLGGVETPMAYAGGIIYVPVVNLYSAYTPSGSTAGQALNQGTGELLAIDVNTGKILWDNSLPSINFGGATVVNDLVFTSTFDGMIYAFNRTTGAQVWSYQAPGGVNAWPAFAGNYMLLPVGLASPFAVMMAFSLGTNAPTVAMTPLDGATVSSGNITVSAMAFNFNIVDKQGQPGSPGEGHLHYFMDVDAPTAPGVPAIPTSGNWTHTTAKTYTWTNVAPGTHTFSVELVNNDHSPLNPPVVAKVTVTVVPPTPKVTILLPQNRSTISPGDVTVSVQVNNLNLVNKIGQAVASGEGHINYFLDVVAPTTPGQPAVTAAGTYTSTANLTYTWTNVAPGTHTFSVELVNNDNTPLNPPVVVKVVVVISTATGGGP